MNRRNAAAFLTAFVGLTAGMPSVGYATVFALPSGPYLEPQNATITLIGDQSFDSTSLAITYGWDLNNDGIFTDSLIADPLYNAGSIYNLSNVPVGSTFVVGLKVTNSSGQSSVGYSTVEITAPTTVSSVPEPSSIAILLVALVATLTSFRFLGFSKSA